MVQEILAANPGIVYVAGAGAVAGISILAYKQFSQDDEKEMLETEGFERRIKKIFTNPTKSNGSKVKDFAKQKGTSSTPRLVGYVQKAKDNPVKVKVWNEEEKVWSEREEDGTTYTILEGSGKLGLYAKAFVHSLMPGDGLTKTHDVPQDLIIPGDKYIWFAPEYHPVEFNGVKRHFSPEGMSRVWESSYSGFMENYLDAQQDIPEQLQGLNNRVAGQLKVDNNKSENIRRFKQEEDRREKDLD